ncbi:hypothetical protein GCM10010274_34560 [Streptomyces lavendofoliae]|uniref:Uncharacterized protein n=1 Tax=Streptomyces lavendofoliae TaxID=67314 RepID=A0A918M5I0_9ACTN|nr:hypothetical protein GCM10010274_34560 [Streptomyces lavendofoliae]
MSAPSGVFRRPRPLWGEGWLCWWGAWERAGEVRRVEAAERAAVLVTAAADTSYRERPRDPHGLIEAEGPFAAHSCRTLVEARKPLTRRS